MNSPSSGARPPATKTILGPGLECDEDVVLLLLPETMEVPSDDLDGERLLENLQRLDLTLGALPDATRRGRIAAAVEVIAAGSLGRPAGTVRPSRLAGDGGYLLPLAPKGVVEAAIRIAALAGRAIGDEAIERLRNRLARMRAMLAGAKPWRDPVAPLIAAQAASMGLPCRWSTVMPQTQVLGEGRRQVRMIGSYPLVTPAIGRLATEDKTWSASLLGAMGLPVAPHRIVADADAAVRAAEEFGYPVVLKSVDGTMAVGVTVDIATAAEVRAAFPAAAAAGSAAMVQPFFDMPEHRAFVMEGRLRIAYQRNPPYVRGDGQHTIEALIGAHNAAVAAGTPIFPGIRPVPIDDHLRRTLARSGHSLETIPAADQEIVLRAIPIRVNGGYVTDVTARMHPDNVHMLERAQRLSGLILTGIDFRCETVAAPWHAQRFAILELNLRPGILDIEPERVAGEIVGGLFPEPNRARLPTLLVLDDAAGDLAPLRDALREAGLIAGVSGPDGTFLDRFATAPGERPIGEAHAVMVEDPTADIAIHVARPRQIAGSGLGLRVIDHVLLAAASSGAMEMAVMALVTRHARRRSTLPSGSLERIAAIVAAAMAAVRDSPLPPYAGRAPSALATRRSASS